MNPNLPLARIGRIFYGIAIAAFGLMTICYRDFTYFMIPPGHVWMTDHVLLIYFCGAFLFLAGAAIVFEKKLQQVTLLLGTVFLVTFCFYFVPYELLVSTNYMHFGAWENAAKTLALAGGAFVISDRVSGSDNGFVRKLILIGVVCYPLTIISFSIDHFLYAKQAAGYVPSWIANPVFWLYLTGSALLGSGLAIVLKIKPRLFAGLLGLMIFIWVIILHIPKVVAAPISDGGEISSAFLALAYCGTALIIAGAASGRSSARAGKPAPEPDF